MTLVNKFRKFRKKKKMTEKNEEKKRTRFCSKDRKFQSNKNDCTNILPDQWNRYTFVC